MHNYLTSLGTYLFVCIKMFIKIFCLWSRNKSFVMSYHDETIIYRNPEKSQFFRNILQKNNFTIKRGVIKVHIGTSNCVKCFFFNWSSCWLVFTVKRITLYVCPCITRILSTGIVLRARPNDATHSAAVLLLQRSGLLPIRYSGR